jgi:hypothetical protein
VTPHLLQGNGFIANPEPYVKEELQAFVQNILQCSHCPVYCRLFKFESLASLGLVSFNYSSLDYNKEQLSPWDSFGETINLLDENQSM